MNCPQCGVENRDPFVGSVSACGAPVPAPSARPAGSSNEALGSVLRGLRPAASGPGVTLAPPRAPQAYTPKHLAERILTSRRAMEGERKHVTVLFVGVDSARLAQQLDPELMHEIMDSMLRLMAETVHRYEGRSTSTWATG